MAQKYRRMEAENESLRSFVTHRMLDLWQGVQMNGERTAGTMQQVLMTVSNDHDRHMEFVRRHMDNRPYLGVPPVGNPIQYPAPQFPAPSDPDYPPAELVTAATARLASPPFFEDSAMYEPADEGVTHPSSTGGGGRSPPVFIVPPTACPPAESQDERAADEGEDGTADRVDEATAAGVDSTAAGDPMEESAEGRETNDAAGHEPTRDTADDGTAAQGTAASSSNNDGSSAPPAAKPAVGRAAPIVRSPSSRTRAGQKRALSLVPEGQEVGTAVKKQKHT